jgi:hypothetical protein
MSAVRARLTQAHVGRGMMHDLPSDVNLSWAGRPCKPHGGLNTDLVSYQWIYPNRSPLQAFTRNRRMINHLHQIPFWIAAIKAARAVAVCTRGLYYRRFMRN